MYYTCIYKPYTCIHAFRGARQRRAGSCSAMVFKIYAHVTFEPPSRMARTHTFTTYTSIDASRGARQHGVGSCTRAMSCWKFGAIWGEYGPTTTRQVARVYIQYVCVLFWCIRYICFVCMCYVCICIGMCFVFRTFWLYIYIYAYVLQVRRSVRGICAGHYTEGKACLCYICIRICYAYRMCICTYVYVMYVNVVVMCVRLLCSLCICVQR